MRQPMTLATASPAVAAAVAWTRERSRREQVLIAFFGGFLLLTLFWFAILRPLLGVREASITRIAAYESIQTRVANAGTLTPGAALPDGPLESVIVIQSAPFGITPTNVAVEGDGVAITLTAARYDSVIPWLASLEGSGLVIGELRMTRAAAEGTVDATMTVTRP